MGAVDVVEADFFFHELVPPDQMRFQPFRLALGDGLQRDGHEHVHQLDGAARVVVRRDPLHVEREVGPVGELVPVESHVVHARGRGVRDDVVEHLVLGEEVHGRGDGVGVVFVEEVEEVGEVEDAFDPVELAHAEFDVRREVEGAEEFDLVAGAFERLGDFKGDHRAVAVAGDGVGTARLERFHRGVVGGDYVRDGFVEVFAFETAGAEGVDGAVEDVLGEVEEDEDFADAGVDEPEGGLGALAL